jgi:putative endonuclease
MHFCTYILRSVVDDSYYIGYTHDIEKRVAEHNAGLSKYTSKKMPWILVYKEYYNSKTEAIKRERFLKKQRNKEFYQRLIDSYRADSSAG